MDLFQSRKRQLYEELAVRKNALRTLQDRGFKVPDPMFMLSLDDFTKIREKELHHIFFLKLENIDGSVYEGGGVLMYFESSDKIDKKSLQQLLIRLEKEYPTLDKLYIILHYGSKQKKINFNVIDELKNYPHVEIMENIYPFSITDNILMPKCVKLSDDEKSKVFEIIGKQLPKMIYSDPVAIRYNAKIGDVLKIIRDGGLDISYRIITEQVVL